MDRKLVLRHQSHAHDWFCCAILAARESPAVSGVTQDDANKEQPASTATQVQDGSPSEPERYPR